MVAKVCPCFLTQSYHSHAGARFNLNPCVGLTFPWVILAVTGNEESLPMRRIMKNGRLMEQNKVMCYFSQGIYLLLLAYKFILCYCAHLKERAHNNMLVQSSWP